MTIEEQLKEKKHTIIDASAGTGKTYTICEIVIYRLKAGYNIEDFIIMTYTEKAAGELVDRIRKRIREELNKDIGQEERNNLEKALSHFDYATISTIHGFCQSILREYAFECNIPYKQELNNDNDFLKYAYGNITFKYLIDKINNLQPDQVKKLFSKNRGSYEETIFNIASDINIDRDKLLPIPNKYEYEITPEEIDLVNKFYSVDFSDLVDFLRDKNNGCNGNTVNGLLRVANPIFGKYEELVINNNENTINDFISFIIGKKYTDKAIECLRKYYSQKFSDLSDDDLNELVNINNSISNKYDDFILSFKAQIIEDVSKEYKDIRKNNLTITFNDMILLVADSLRDEKSPLKSILQKRYKIGIIDEFQDTSPSQWDIAKEIFLNRKKQDDILPHHLIIVGDEKQSIYSFQGANVETYKNAKKIMKDDYEAQTIELKDNYRSSKEIIDCFNRIFSQKDILNKDFWFPYNPVSFPEKGYSKKDYSNDTPLVVYEVEPTKNKKTGDYADFIANEIKNNYKKGYNFSDICILIRNGKDADDLTKIFNKKKIPYTHYKKTGLYNSLEGNELNILLSALAFPYEKQYLKDLILTRFFPEYTIKSLNIDESLMSLIEKKLEIWREYFNKYGFYYMMENIFLEQNLFSNILSKEFYSDKSLVEPSVSERSITNFKHLVKKLIDNGYKNNSLLDYYNTLNDFRNQKKKEEDFQENDTEKEKVQIMTMHASKGLEFKVVYIYGPFDVVRSQNTYTIIQKENKIWTLDKNQDIYPFCDEDFKEKVFATTNSLEKKHLEKLDYYTKEIDATEKEYNERFEKFGKDDFKIITDYKSTIDNNSLKPATIENRKKKYEEKNYTPEQLEEYDIIAQLGDKLKKLIKDKEAEEKVEIKGDDILSSLDEKLSIEETKRLLYVAFTRAKDKLYLPYIIPDSEDKGKKTFAENIINKGIENIYKEFIYKPNIQYNENLKVIKDTDNKKEENSIPVFEEQNTNINDVSHKQRYINSFSKRYGIDFVDLGIITKEELESFDLNNNIYLEEINVSNDDKGILYSAYGENSELIIEDTEEEYKEESFISRKYSIGKQLITGRPVSGSQGSLPGGTRTGNMLHEIFESINFENIMNKGIFGNWKAFQESESNERYIIEEITKKYNLRDEYKENVLIMVWNTLHTPLFRNFSIGNIKTAFKEIQFEMNIKDKYLTGIIDMIFEYEGNIYIIDWKSNKSSDGNYGDKDVEDIMKEHYYKLQYALYKKAVNQWLKLNGINKEVAGGFYVFLRDAEKGNKAKVVVMK